MSQDRITIKDFELFAIEKMRQKPAPRCKADKVNVCGPVFSHDSEDACINCACEWLKVKKEDGLV